MISAAGDSSASTILLGTVDDVGDFAVRDDMIELCRRLVVPCAPSLTVVEADCRPLIRSKNHAVGILGIDPNLMIIVSARRPAENRNRFSSVDGSIKSDVRDVNHIAILRVDGDAVEVPRTAGEARIRVLQSPTIATIVRAIQTCLLCLNQCVNAFTICRNVHSNASPITFGQTVGQPRPGFPAILRPVQPATGSVDRSIGTPRRTTRIPRAGEQQLRIARADRQVRNPDFRSFIEDLGPIRSSIDRFVHPTLFVWSIGMAESTHVDNGRISRINYDSADLARIV